jgi:virginiamycin B lyase
VTEFSLGSTFVEPWGITAGSDGNLWFTEENKPAIGRITPSGTVTEFPISAGNDSGEYIISGSDGALWFANPEPGSGYAFQRMTTAGVFSGYPDTTGSPYGITNGPDGNIWFTAQNNGGISYVVRITPAGVETAFGDTNPGTGSPGLTPGAYGIATGSDGRLWFTHGSLNGSAGIIGALNPTTGVITEYPIASGTNGLAIVAGLDGALWFTAQTASGISLNRITTSGTFTAYNSPLAGVPPLTIGPDGNVWSIDQNSGYLYDFAENFTPTSYAGTTNLNYGFAYNYPGITTGPDGNVWFTESQFNKIGRLNVAGTLGHARRRLAIPTRH